MGMWSMNTKTFVKIYAEVEEPKKILKAQYVIISSRIRKTGIDPNVISMSKLFPNPVMMSDYRMDLDPGYFTTQYERQLDSQKHLLALLVSSALDLGEPIIFLCTPKEWKLGYMKIIASYIEREFQYNMIDYKKYKKHPWKMEPPDINHVVDLCTKAIREKQEETWEEKMRTPEGRMDLVKGMSKSEMANELKRLHLYYKDLRKSEMRELLELFFVP